MLCEADLAGFEVICCYISSADRVALLGEIRKLTQAAFDLGRSNAIPEPPKDAPPSPLHPN